MPVTVILPVYNGMPYLPAALRSVLRQAIDDLSVIVVNDGSTDGSEEYLRAVADPRVSVLSQSNGGIGAARNAGLERCRSEYVALMDQDDISLPNRLLSQVAYLETHPDVVMVGSQIEFVVGEAVQRALPVPLDHNGIERRLLRGQAGLCHPSLMFRTSVAMSVGGYPVGVLGEDIDFCLRMCEAGRVANLGQILFRYRIHRAQTGLANSRLLCLANHYAAHRALCRRSGRHEPSFDVYLAGLPPAAHLHLYIEAWSLRQYRIGRIELANGRPMSGLIRLWTAALCRPSSVLRTLLGTFTLRGLRTYRLKETAGKRAPGSVT